MNNTNLILSRAVFQLSCSKLICQIIVFSQLPLVNAFVLGNLLEYRHKLHIAKTRAKFSSQITWVLRSDFNHFDHFNASSLKAQSNDHYVVQGHWRSPIIVVLSKALMNFLLVNSTNLHPVSHRFRVSVDYWSTSLSTGGTSFLTHLFGLNQ